MKYLCTKIHQIKILNVFLIIIIIILFPLEIFAQSDGTIKGKIIEAETQNPVGYSSIALYALADSSLITGVISDENGNFLLADIPPGNYYLDISYMGYQKTSRNNIKIDNNTASFDVGTVELQKEVKELEGVEIKGELLKAKVEVDRTVYSVNSEMTTAAHSGLEILRQVPTVGVDFQNNITINGSSNILIFVDGKQRDGDYLSQLSPAAIEKIEVMETPSAKYSSEVSAVLFVITKKEARLGISGRLETEIPVCAQKVSNNSANIEYGYKNIRFFVSGYMHYESFEDVKIPSKRESDIDNVNSLLEQHGGGLGTFTYQSIQYGMDYFLNDKNSFSFYGNYRPPILGDEMDGPSTTQLQENSIITKYFITDYYEQNENEAQYYSIFYKHTFSKPAHELSADVNYYDFNGVTETNYQTQYYDTDGTNPIGPIGDLIVRDEIIKNQRYRIRTKIDYSHPLSENLKFETGYEGEIQWYDNKYFETDDQLADQLDYEEKHHSGYISFAGKWNKLSYQAGLRGENSDILINNDTTVDYFCLQPQFNLNYQFDKTNSMKLSYRKSIRRPSVNDLNPFVRYSDSLHLSHGNPELLPRYKHRLELSYTKNLKSNYITSSIYMLYFKNMFNSIVTINEDNVSESYVDNVCEGSEYGFSVRAGFQVLKFWRLNSDIFMFYKELHGTKNAGIYDIPNQDIYCWRGGLTSLMFFPKDIMLIFYGRYASPNIDPQVTNSRDPVYIVALQKDLFKQKGQIGVYSYLPFWKEFVAHKSEHQGSDFTESSSVNIPVRSLITFKFSYRFNYGKKIKKIERDSDTEEDNGGGGLF